MDEDKKYKKPAWTTRNEMEFIKKIGIGIHSQSARVLSKTQAELLQGYINGAKKRINWDGIDKDTVIGFAEEKLRNIKMLMLKGV